MNKEKKISLAYIIVGLGLLCWVFDWRVIVGLILLTAGVVSYKTK